MVDIKKVFGLSVLILLILIPIFIWSSMMPLSVRFSDYASSTRSLGQLTGLVGTCLFALTFVLATRSKLIEKYLLGLDKMYILHSLIGSLAFILLLFHPLLLTLRLLPANVKQAALWLLPGSSWAFNFGIFALLGMIILISLTFFIRIKYSSWKLSHKFLGFVFIMACFHFFFVSSDVSKSVLLKNYMIFISALGIICFLYASFFRRLLLNNYTYIVDEVIIKEPHTIVYLKPKDEKMNFKAGQFAYLKFYNFFIYSEQHPFTIASSPQEDRLRFVIKSLGDYTSQVRFLKKGTSVEIEGPYGAFSKDNFGAKQVWISGGIGLTPFLSMAETIKDNSQEIDFYYCTRNETQAVLIEEFKEIASKHKSFRVFTLFSENGERISLDIIKNKTKDWKEREFLLCGPESLTDSLINSLKKEGISSSKIHNEAFDLR